LNLRQKTAKGIGYYPDVNLYINNLPEYGFNQINYAASGVQNKRCFDEYFELGFTFK
jgi:hypothetical protein